MFANILKEWIEILTFKKTAIDIRRKKIGLNETLFRYFIGFFIQFIFFLIFSYVSYLVIELQEAEFRIFSAFILDTALEGVSLAGAPLISAGITFLGAKILSGPGTFESHVEIVIRSITPFIAILYPILYGVGAIFLYLSFYLDNLILMLFTGLFLILGTIVIFLVAIYINISAIAAAHYFTKLRGFATAFIGGITYFILIILIAFIFGIFGLILPK